MGTGSSRLRPPSGCEQDAVAMSDRAIEISPAGAVSLREHGRKLFGSRGIGCTQSPLVAPGRPGTRVLPAASNRRSRVSGHAAGGVFASIASERCSLRSNPNCSTPSCRNGPRSSCKGTLRAGPSPTMAFARSPTLVGRPDEIRGTRAARRPRTSRPPGWSLP